MTKSISKPADVPVAPPLTAASPARPPDWAALSDQGHERGNNEDACGAFALDGQLTPLAPLGAPGPEHGVLFVLSDGMGGARAGEEASRLCLEHLSLELHGRLGSSNPGAALREAFVATHAALTALSRSNPDLEGMGATLTVLWLQPAGAAMLGHVGDSRLYGCREGRWRQWTDDHTVEAGLVRRGHFTPAMAARLRFRSLLEQVMGGDGRPIDPQIVTADWQPGDAFALCTDGLYRPLAGGLEAQLTTALQQPEPAAGARQLIDAANAAGGPDNITVLLARLALPDEE